jgi:hypothetical protein
MTRRSHPMAIAIAVKAAVRRGGARRALIAQARDRATASEIRRIRQESLARYSAELEAYQASYDAWARLPFWKRRRAQRPHTPIYYPPAFSQIWL